MRAHSRVGTTLAAAFAAIAGTCLAGLPTASAQPAAPPAAAAGSQHGFGALPASQVHVVRNSHRGMAVGERPAPCAHVTAHAAGQTMRCNEMIATDASGKFLIDPARPLVDGYGPADMQSAYNLDVSQGEGKTIAVVDAYGDSDAESDLAVFRTQFDLPPCTTDNGCFTKLDQNGGTDYPADDTKWATETALDLAAVSSTCPLCHIVLVESTTNLNPDMEAAEATAAAQPGVVAISNSWGQTEGPGQVEQDGAFVFPGIATVFSSGDYGELVQWPSSIPAVFAVGGTTLTKDADSPRGWDETVWGDGVTGQYWETASGCSLYQPRPDYQSGVRTLCPGHRATNDISADADSDTGLAVYTTLGWGGWGVAGGTSLAAPLIAGMIGLARSPVAGTEPSSYPYDDPNQSSDINDITTGSDGGCEMVWCDAGPGWDGPSGVGTPNGVGALQAYVGPQITSAPGTRFAAGTPGSFEVTTDSIPAASLSDGGATLPAGLTFTDNGDGTATLAGTPAAGSEGSYPLTITASNGVQQDATQQFTLVVDAPESQPEWLPTSPSASPPATLAPGLADDPANGGMLMFGGEIHAQQQMTDQTWLWDGSTWTQLDPAHHPVARDCQAMAYDAATGQLVLFGGAGANGYLGDMWVWDGSDWTEEEPADSPPPLTCANLAYDSTTQQLVLFGGVDQYGNAQSGTWVWDGSDWTEESPTHSPPARYGAVMTDDPADGEVLLLDGLGDYDVFNDTWTWDGSDWTEQHPAHTPTADIAATGFYDPARDQVVVFGGQTTQLYDETWVWDGDDWVKQAPPDHPTARANATSGYDTSAAEGVLFGGYIGVGGYLSDTWLMGPSSPPTSLQAAPGPLEVSLSWDAPATQGDSPITGYEIFRGTTPGGESTTPLATVDGSTLSFDDTSGLYGTTYYYVVRAVNGSGESLPSGEASGTPDMAPTQTDVTSNPAAPVFGQSVTFTAQVSNGLVLRPPMGGNVTFYLDGTQLGVPVPIAQDGTATSQAVPDLTPGDHQVEADYSGDFEYEPSQGAATTTVGCDRTITGQRLHSITVSNATCVTGALVSGWIHVKAGGALALMNSTVDGDLTSTGAVEVLACGSALLSKATVTGTTGPVELAPAGTGCGQVTVNGATKVSGNTAGVLIGDTKIAGPLTVHGNGVSVVITGDQVRGRASVSANIAPQGITVSGSTFDRRLACFNNDPPPQDDGSPNHVGGQAVGQCAGLGGAATPRHEAGGSAG